MIAFCAFAGAAVAADVTPPDVRGTWKGNSETIVLGSGNLHHTATAKKAEPEFRSVPFTMVIDKQDGRRFSGTFASPRKSEKVLAVISRTGAIHMVTDDVGYTLGHDAGAGPHGAVLHACFAGLAHFVLHRDDETAVGGCCNPDLSIGRLKITARAVPRRGTVRRP